MVVLQPYLGDSPGSGDLDALAFPLSWQCRGTFCLGALLL